MFTFNELYTNGDKNGLEKGYSLLLIHKLTCRGLKPFVFPFTLCT